MTCKLTTCRSWACKETATTLINATTRELPHHLHLSLPVAFVLVLKNNRRLSCSFLFVFLWTQLIQKSRQSSFFFKSTAYSARGWLELFLANSHVRIGNQSLEREDANCWYWKENVYSLTKDYNVYGFCLPWWYMIATSVRPVRHCLVWRSHCGFGKRINMAAVHFQVNTARALSSWVWPSSPFSFLSPPLAACVRQ